MKVSLEINLIGGDDKSLGKLIRGKSKKFEWQPVGTPWTYSADALKEIAKECDTWNKATGHGKKGKAGGI